MAILRLGAGPWKTDGRTERNSMAFAAIFLLLIGLPVLGVLLLHPVGAAVVLLASTPFDSLFYVLAGPTGNLITLVPVVVFLARTPPRLWVDSFMGTRAQQMMLAFVLALLVCHAMSIDQFGFYAILEYGRKIALFLLVGVVSGSMKTPRNTMSCNRALVLGMSAFALLSIVEFYFGVHVLPMASYWGTEGAIGAVWNENTANDFRLRGAGDAVSVNRFANWMLLPAFLGVGWFVQAKSRREKSLSLVALVALSMALLGTISRSAFIGAAAGSLVLLAVTFRSRPIQALAILVIGLVAAGLLALLAVQMGLDDLVLYRFSSQSLGESGREGRWATAFSLFARSPIIGLGVGNYATYAGAWTGDSHNAYLNLLVESGLFGLSIQIAMLGYVLYRLARRPIRADGIYAWRPYYLAAFISILISNFFNSYAFERVLWFAMAYAAALERAERTARAAARETVAPLFRSGQAASGIEEAFGSTLAGNHDG
jgi:hypothetical protein